MKTSLISILFILPFVIFGQTKLDTVKIKLKYSFQTQPTYFLDSVKVDLSKTYIDLTNVESIKVTKATFVDSNDLNVGKVFITSKNKKHSWLTLTNFKEMKSIPDSNSLKLLIIDGYVISDPSNVKIEASFIKKWDILNLATTGSVYCKPSEPILIITTKQLSKSHRLKKRH
jgi:hypothetical protein